MSISLLPYRVLIQIHYSGVRRTRCTGVSSAKIKEKIGFQDHSSWLEKYANAGTTQNETDSGCLLRCLTSFLISPRFYSRLFLLPAAFAVCSIALSPGCRGVVGVAGCPTCPFLWSVAWRTLRPFKTPETVVRCVSTDSGSNGIVTSFLLTSTQGCLKLRYISMILLAALHLGCACR